MPGAAHAEAVAAPPDVVFTALTDIARLPNGNAVGALLAGILAGILADAVSITAAIWALAVLTAVSGVVVLVRTYETHPAGAEPRRA